MEYCKPFFAIDGARLDRAGVRKAACAVQRAGDGVAIVATGSIAGWIVSERSRGIRSVGIGAGDQCDGIAAAGHQ
ncbi:hypothetical protein DL238_11425 [Alteriqipengyuania lutimaris]|uniref:Uncharacterized protein n=1 Tax=Alteriqipengyuania lutimaris TaxID=1538146 RepID=A0A395LUP3_9SPHN|nr:hypothetical protein DL238_11425 [Alteriqipengyuania lutimaris]